MPTKEDTVISAWLAAHGHPEWAWEPAEKCPQGHDNDDPECGGALHDIGEICYECWHAWAQKGDYGAANDARIEYYYDRTWHPEWRIQAVPKDFSLPTPLLAAVRTFVRTRTQDGSFWSYQTSWRPDEARAEIREEIIESWGFEIGRGYAEEDPSDEYKALRAALAAAMEGEKGGESTHV